jgi:hypothetical protein
VQCSAVAEQASMPAFADQTPRPLYSSNSTGSSLNTCVYLLIAPGEPEQAPQCMLRSPLLRLKQAPAYV